MPWIDPIEDYAAPPRLPKQAGGIEAWDGTYEGGDGIWRLEGVAIDGATVTVEAGDLIELFDVSLSQVRLETDGSGRLDIIDCVLTDCDLSRASIGTLRGSRLIGCKLAGTDMAERTIRDCAFERCTLTYANLRMTTLVRVSIADCRLDETDLSGANLEDVTFAGSELIAVSTDRSRFERVDLRGTHGLDLTTPANLGGCLIDDTQVLELAYRLALLAGATIERDPNTTEPAVT
jgi:uncharacterized protein YjbI with pentapeptide repeats